LLLTDLDVDVVNIFDTGRALRSMMKAGSKGEPHLVSFEKLAEVFLNIRPNKYFQIAEWRLRPLPKVMLNYCRADAHYLQYIYAILTNLLRDTNPVALMDKFQEDKDNKNWINLRNQKSKKWKSVMKEFTKRMNKFIKERIEKTSERKYDIIIHHH
jgi:ribonuclease D